MCEPTTLAMIGMGMQVVGTLSSANAAKKQAEANQQAAQYQASVARNNAQIAEWQAQDAVDAGEKAAQDHQRKVAALKGTQTATMAARGLDLGEGTPAGILTDTELFGEIDRQTLRHNAAKTAWGYRAQGTNYSADAGLLDMKAANQDVDGAFMGTLLSGAGSVADSWYKFKKVS